VKWYLFRYGLHSNFRKLKQNSPPNEKSKIVRKNQGRIFTQYIFTALGQFMLVNASEIHYNGVILMCLNTKSTEISLIVCFELLIILHYKFNKENEWMTSMLSVA